MDVSTERLRALASRVSEISALPEQERRRRQWRDLNDLRMSKPMVCVRDYAWEMVCPEGGLGAVLEDPFLRSLELDLLGRLFAWSHFQADMVVEPEIEVLAKIRNSMPLAFREESLEGARPQRLTCPRRPRDISAVSSTRMTLRILSRCPV